MADESFPDGKMNTEDEGTIQTAIGVENGKVMIVWPKLISWIAFDPDSADVFADTIKMRANEVRDLTN